MPSEYRLKVTPHVMAIQVTPETVTRALQWINGVEVTEIDPLDSRITFVGINVPTLDGVQRASQGDYIVSQSGRIKVMSAAEFESMYESI